MAEGGGDVSAAAKQTSMNLRAVVIGGTGSVGRCLVGELLSSKNFSKVVVLGRRNTTVPENYNVNQSEAEKKGQLVQVKVDFETLTKDTVGEHFEEKEVFFNTMGTTFRQAGSASAFVRIDHDYPMKCIGIAKECGVPHMSLVTSIRANANSMILYFKTKAQIEENTKKLNFKSLSIFRPGLLDRGADARIGEKIYGWFSKSIKVSEVAKAMRIDAEQVAKSLSTAEDGKEAEVKIYRNPEIYKICKEQT